jgi:uncharacterized protein YjbI with pentapeptide repeats
MIKKNRWTLRLIFGIAFLLANQHAFADSPGLTPTSEETIDHILETRQCVAGCSISQADLAGVDLQNASLTGAYIIVIGHRNKTVLLRMEQKFVA